jgi:hypothetical protein
MAAWLNFMTRTDVPRAEYLLKAFAITIVGTAVFTTLAVLLVPSADTGQDAETAAPPFFGYVVVWPLVSTLLIWAVLERLKRVTPTYWHAAAGSAVAFGVLFFFLAGLQGALIFLWPYFMYSLTFLAWQLKSVQNGLIMAFLLQAGANAATMLLM